MTGFTLLGGQNNFIRACAHNTTGMYNGSGSVVGEGRVPQCTTTVSLFPAVGHTVVASRQSATAHQEVDS